MNTFLHQNLAAVKVSHIFLLIIFLSVMKFAKAQQSGLINYPHLGVQFTIPEGWIGQETEGGFIVGHPSKPGFAFLSMMEATSIEEIRAQGQQGIREADGTYLQLQGSIEQLNANSLGGLFSGTLQQSPAKAYMLGVLNPHGSGVLVMAASTPEQYSEMHKQLAVDLANSLAFSKPEVPPVAQEWKQRFSNAKLTYMDSYYSSGSSYGGYSTGGGYSVTKEIHLCAQGYFKSSGSSSMSIDTGGAFGNSRGSSSGDGSWEIAGNQYGQPILRLKFHNGEVREYTLTSEEGKTFLNGERYYVTYASSGPDYAPDCF